MKNGVANQQALAKFAYGMVGVMNEGDLEAKGDRTTSVNKC